MFITIIGLIIGLLVTAGGGYYFIKDKNDPESRKIYGIAALIGAVVTVIILLRFF